MLKCFAVPFDTTQNLCHFHFITFAYLSVGDGDLKKGEALTLQIQFSVLSFSFVSITNDSMLVGIVGNHDVKFHSINLTLLILVQLRNFPPKL